ncbi:hypothetical protein [Dokdonella immobilis]|uniref:Uncharacterized protein n=1 Tax=Dokdonella immobilis TaxID=578942 RepID=A0A1I5ASF0_9GAMM|nr:hypothetical protein [Dokdonella immobilis]SFN65375.1 hypothetical protein SAMN05216289_14212 [Dokdonella immobilis]
MDAVKVTPLLKAETTRHGQPIDYPGGKAELNGLPFEIAPGARTGWHLNPRVSFAEVIDALHEGHNDGSSPIRIAVFPASAVGDILAVRDKTTE